MIKNYSLLYEYSSTDDKLYIFVDELASSYEEERNKDVSVLTRNNVFIGYIIHNIKQVVKIKNSGMIYLPHQVLIEVVNNILKRNKLEELTLKTESGYVVSKIVEIGERIKVDTGKSVIECDMSICQTLDDLVVVALKGSGLIDKTIVKDDGHICSYKDLGINEDDNPFILDEENEVGKDFFLMEAKVYA